jgi:phosphoribosylformylglycinamidine synthase
MIHRIEIATRRGLRDARGEHVASKVRSFLDIPVVAIRTRDVYHIEAEISQEEIGQIVQEFADPVLQEGAIGRAEDGPFDIGIRVAYKPGVADPVRRGPRPG